MTIAVLLDTLGIDDRRVAVEHNFIVIKRDMYHSTMVHDGDEVEIVNFVGGGQGTERQTSNFKLQTPDPKKHGFGREVVGV